MNVIKLLKPKDTVFYIYNTNTLRQGLEKMKAHSYTAIPVISDNGCYVGTASEGDFLWYILDDKYTDYKQLEKYTIDKILRPEFNPAVKIDVNMEELLNRAMKQNFIPVTDDRNTFIGIVTRQDIIKYFVEKNK